MSTHAKKRQKLCLSCDASVDIDVIVCPYCGADLTQAKENMNEEPRESLLYSEQNISSLYPPPYQEKKLYEESFEPEQTSDVEKPTSQNLKSLAILPIFFVSLGMMLFTLGLFILVFSTNGQAILKWNAKYWFLYILFSVPLMVFGYKSLDRLDEEISEE